MQISKFFSFCLGLLSLGGDGAPRCLETGGPHGLQRTLGPWSQDSAACAEGGDGSSPPKLLQRLQGGQRRGSGSGDPCAERWEMALSTRAQPAAPAVQPLHGVLASLVLSTGTSS